MSGIVPRQETLALDHLDLGAVAARERACGLGELGRAHVRGGRVDEIAGEEDGVGTALDRGTVGTLGPDEGRERLGLLAVAREAIGAERPAESRLCRRLGAEGRIEAVDAFGQALRQCRQGPQLVMPLAADEDAGELARLPGDEAELARLGRETGRLHPTAQGGAGTGEPTLELRLDQGGDGQRLSRGLGHKISRHRVPRLCGGALLRRQG